MRPTIILRRFVIAALVLGSLLIASPGRAAGDATSFIQNLGDQGIQILRNSGMSQPQRKEQFSRLFRNDFDVPAISRFVLGRYWRTASAAQQEQFTKVFRDYVVAVYSEQFSNYTGETFRVTGQQTLDPTTTMVASEIDRPNGGPPIHVNWIVENIGGNFKIVDVAVENLSMRTTQRDEFASVIERNGGNIQTLINQLQTKVQQSA